MKKPDIDACKELFNSGVFYASEIEHFLDCHDSYKVNADEVKFMTTEAYCFFSHQIPLYEDNDETYEYLTFLVDRFKNTQICEDALDFTRHKAGL